MTKCCKDYHDYHLITICDLLGLIISEIYVWNTCDICVFKHNCCEPCFSDAADDS